MSAADDTRTLGRARLSFADAAEVDEFARTLERFERGEITPDQWRVFRLLRGTYGQRQPGNVQMLRAKIPQGLLTGPQLHALADVADRHSRGWGHITTRQNVQFHFVPLDEVPQAMHRLAEAGVTTREACGNSVRNITTCPLAGVAPDEPFDVTPFAEAMTRYLLRHPLSSTLPRKFKIAFEGCAVDHVWTSINDLGFRAVIAADGQRAFRVTAGGGTSTLARSGGLLHEALPARDLLRTAEAVLRVFQRLGDYEHKQRNRMKFLIRALGWERWRDEYLHEYAACAGVPALSIDPSASEQAPAGPDGVGMRPEEAAARVSLGRTAGPGLAPRVVPVLHSSDEAFAAWRMTNVTPQKQAGFAAVTITVPLGDLTSHQMRVIAQLADSHGDGTVRTTADQDLVMRWVRSSDVRGLHRTLAAAGLGLAGAGTIADVASCPGAESCRLAVTQSRGLARLLEDHLRARPELVDAAASARIRISGCPNGCGQHHLGTIGFQGSVRRLDGRAVPQYFVMVGGGHDGDGARFARLAAKIPARRIPEALDRLIALYEAAREPGEAPDRFFQRVAPAEVSAALRDLERLDAAGAAPEDFVDLAESATFTPEVLEGECSA